MMQDELFSLLPKTAYGLYIASEDRTRDSSSHCRHGRADDVLKTKERESIHKLILWALRIWAIDVAEELSRSVDVDAFDISDKFFPPSSWLPSNLTLRRQDIFKEFPEELHGKYDVVHFRLFLTLSTDRLRQALDNAIKLLRKLLPMWFHKHKTF